MRADDLILAAVARLGDEIGQLRGEIGQLREDVQRHTEWHVEHGEQIEARLTKLEQGVRRRTWAGLGGLSLASLVQVAQVVWPQIAGKLHG